MILNLFPRCRTLIIYSDVNETKMTLDVIKSKKSEMLNAGRQLFGRVFLSKLPACNIRKTGPVLMEKAPRSSLRAGVQQSQPDLSPSTFQNEGRILCFAGQCMLIRCVSAGFLCV